MKCKRKIMVGIAFVAVALCILFQLNTSGRKKSELIVEEVDLKNNCIYATAKNQLYNLWRIKLLERKSSVVVS